MAEFTNQALKTPLFHLTKESKDTLKNKNGILRNEEIIVLFITEGTLRLFANYGFYGLNQWDLVFLNSFVPYAFLDASEDAEFYALEFSPELAFQYGTDYTNDEDWKTLAVTKKSACEIFSLPPHADMATHFQNMLFIDSEKPYAYELSMHSHILFLCNYFFKKWNTHAREPIPASAKNIELARNVMTYIGKNFHSVTKAELSAKFGYTHSVFSKIFKLIADCSISEYIQNAKREHAKFLLLTTEKNITEIAFSAGYEDASYFAKTFLESEGISPTKFRSQYQ